MPTVASLHVYPLKGAAGFSVERWPVDELGLRHDRRFMLVTDDGKFVSQRNCARLALIRTSIDDEVLKLTCDLGEVKVALPPTSDRRATVVVWDDALEGVFVSAEADALFSNFLGQSCRLTWMPNDATRLTDLKRGEPRRHVSLADAAPALLVAEEALNELNTRLLACGELPVTLDRFRGNIIVRGRDSGTDDEWSSIPGPLRDRASSRE